jgi:hypothetical protein
MFAVSDNLFIRGEILTVTGNGNFYCIIMCPKVQCKTLHCAYTTGVHTSYCHIFNKTFLYINPVKLK